MSGPYLQQTDGYQCQDPEGESVECSCGDVDDLVWSQGQSIPEGQHGRGNGGKSK